MVSCVSFTIGLTPVEAAKFSKKNPLKDLEREHTAAVVTTYGHSINRYKIGFTRFQHKHISERINQRDVPEFVASKIEEFYSGIDNIKIIDASSLQGLIGPISYKPPKIRIKKPLPEADLLKVAAAQGIDLLLILSEGGRVTGDRDTWHHLSYDKYYKGSSTEAILVHATFAAIFSREMFLKGNGLIYQFPNRPVPYSISQLTIIDTQSRIVLGRHIFGAIKPDFNIPFKLSQEEIRTLEKKHESLVKVAQDQQNAGAGQSSALSLDQLKESYFFDWDRFDQHEPSTLDSMVEGMKAAFVDSLNGLEKIYFPKQTTISKSNKNSSNLTDTTR